MIGNRNKVGGVKWRSECMQCSMTRFVKSLTTIWSMEFEPGPLGQNAIALPLASPTTLPEQKKLRQRRCRRRRKSVSASRKPISGVIRSSENIFRDRDKSRFSDSRLSETGRRMIKRFRPLPPEKVRTRDENTILQKITDGAWTRSYIKTFVE